MAEGFLHDFEGWIVFMACIAVLFFEMWALSLLNTEKRPFAEVFGLELPEPTNENSSIRYRKNTTQFYSVTFLVFVMVALFSLFPEREDIVPARKSLAEFPLELDRRIAKKEVLEKEIINYLGTKHPCFLATCGKDLIIEFEHAPALFKPIIQSREKSMGDDPLVIPKGILGVIRVTPTKMVYHHNSNGIKNAFWFAD